MGHAEQMQAASLHLGCRAGLVHLSISCQKAYGSSCMLLAARAAELSKALQHVSPKVKHPSMHNPPIGGGVLWEALIPA